MFSVALNIVLAPNMTQNANTGRRTQTLLISSLINNVVNVFNNVMYKKNHDIWGCFSYKNIENPREILSLICTEMA